MKRTGLKQRTPLKRSNKRLAHKSKKNSQPHRDKAVIDQYRETHPTCLLCGASREAIHHIFGGTRARCDVRSNLAALCNGCHGYVHTSPVQGKIMCLESKLRIGELDLSELDGMGSERIAGWLARNEPTVGTSLWREWRRLTDFCEECDRE